MKSVLVLLLLLSSSLFARTPTLLKEKITFKPIQALISSVPPLEALWIQGKVVSQEDDSVYILVDDTAMIKIFLCVDNLADIVLSPGEHIAVWGKVDKSPLGSSRNEFYVEKIFDLETPTTTQASEQLKKQ